jgi:hypothetical protein
MNAEGGARIAANYRTRIDSYVGVKVVARGIGLGRCP